MTQLTTLYGLPTCDTCRKAPGSDAEWKLLLKEYPQLIRRPVVVLDDGSVSQGFTDNGFKKLFGVG
jgi:arsenate reductase-like glutaredoxin family protein